MSLELITFNKDSKDIPYFKKVNEESFPPHERMSLEEMFSFAKDTNTDILGIYVNKKPIGFAVLLKNSVCAYLYFLAIDPNMRSKGYGSLTLQKLNEKYPNLQIILDIDVPDKNAPDNSLRIRRKEFYLRNGYHETGRYTLLGEDRFEVLCTGKELCVEGLLDLLQIIHAHRPRLSDKLI